jgi:hypothetical protein
MICENKKAHVVKAVFYALSTGVRVQSALLTSKEHNHGFSGPIFATNYNVGADKILFCQFLYHNYVTTLEIAG